MPFNSPPSFIFLSTIFLFASCKKSDTGPGTPPAPVIAITSISPTSGPSATLDTIVGTNFSAKDSVYINGKSASIVSASATQLIVKVPPYAGSGKVSITVNGTSASGPVFTFTGNTYLVNTFAGSGTPSSIDGTGTAAGLNYPISIAIDRRDNLYVVDGGNDKIRMITPTGAVTTFAGSGIVGEKDGTGASAYFNNPGGIAVDSSGNVYTADQGGNTIRKIGPDRTVSTIAGSGSLGFAEGIGKAAIFNHPGGVAVDNSGNVFVADRDNYKIRKITSTGAVSTFAGSGAQGSADGTAATARFGVLQEMNFDAAGNLYLADPGNNNIRKITRDGVVTTIAGGSVDGGYADGTGLSAVFNGCTSVVVDGNGFIYVADQINDVIRQITPEGAVSVLAGVVNVTGIDDGPALKAKFYYPTSVAIDSHGNIFVADAGNNTIRKLTPQ